MNEYLELSLEEKNFALVELESMAAREDITLGDFVRALRVLVADVDRPTFARMTGVSQRALANVEDGRGSATLKTMTKLFAPFGCRVGVFSPRTATPAVPERAALRGLIHRALAKKRRRRSSAGDIDQELDGGEQPQPQRANAAAYLDELVTKGARAFAMQSRAVANVRVRRRSYGGHRAVEITVTTAPPLRVSSCRYQFHSQASDAAFEVHVERDGDSGAAGSWPIDARDLDKQVPRFVTSTLSDFLAQSLSGNRTSDGE